MGAALMNRNTSLLDDPSMPFLAGALKPTTALPVLAGKVGPLAGIGDRCTIQRITVKRHKPGRRCLVEYVVEYRPRHCRPRTLVMLGKARAKGLDRRGYAINLALRQTGLDDRNPHGVSVPEPLGIAPAFNMWFQERVPGRTAGELLGDADGPAAARRIASGLSILHQAKPVHDRRHTIADEVHILRSQIDKLALARPELALDLERIARGCERLARRIDTSNVRGIHRDFYQDNILMHNEQLWIIDLDLYARGHPAVDAGNFQAHLIELALRGETSGKDIEPSTDVFVDCYIAAARWVDRRDIDVFTTLALARLVAISDRIASRRHTTGMLIELCRKRLAASGSPLPTGI